MCIVHPNKTTDLLSLNSDVCHSKLLVRPTSAVSTVNAAIHDGQYRRVYIAHHESRNDKINMPVCHVYLGVIKEDTSFFSCGFKKSN